MRNVGLRVRKGSCIINLIIRRLSVWRHRLSWLALRIVAHVLTLTKAVLRLKMRRLHTHTPGILIIVRMRPSIWWIRTWPWSLTVHSWGRSSVSIPWLTRWSIIGWRHSIARHWISKLIIWGRRWHTTLHITLISIHTRALGNSLVITILWIILWWVLRVRLLIAEACGWWLVPILSITWRSSLCSIIELDGS